MKCVTRHGSIFVSSPFLSLFFIRLHVTYRIIARHFSHVSIIITFSLLQFYLTNWWWIKKQGKETRFLTFFDFMLINLLWKVCIRSSEVYMSICVELRWCMCVFYWFFSLGSFLHFLYSVPFCFISRFFFVCYSLNMLLITIWIRTNFTCHWCAYKIKDLHTEFFLREIRKKVFNIGWDFLWLKTHLTSHVKHIRDRKSLTPHLSLFSTYFIKKNLCVYEYGIQDVHILYSAVEYDEEHSLQCDRNFGLKKRTSRAKH